MSSGVNALVWISLVSCATVAAGACDGKEPPTGGGNGDVTLTARHGHSTIYDEARRQLLLFGGVGTAGTSASGDRNSTWRYDGTTWTRVATAGPSPRYHAELAYDATRQRVVLFGGFNSTGQQELRDVWEWDGTAWQQSGVTGPTNTISLGVAYEEKTAALYFFSMAPSGGTPTASRLSGRRSRPRQRRRRRAFRFPDSSPR